MHDVALTGTRFAAPFLNRFRPRSSISSRKSSSSLSSDSNNDGNWNPLLLEHEGPENCELYCNKCYITWKSQTSLSELHTEPFCQMSPIYNMKCHFCSVSVGLEGFCIHCFYSCISLHNK